MPHRQLAEPNEVLGAKLRYSFLEPKNTSGLAQASGHRRSTRTWRRRRPARASAAASPSAADRATPATCHLARALTLRRRRRYRVGAAP